MRQRQARRLQMQLKLQVPRRQQLQRFAAARRC
jgi:hypothetical protein